MLELFLILLVCPIAVGGLTLHYAARHGESFDRAFAAALLAGVTSTALVLWAVNECELAWALRQRVRAALTPQELESLRAEGLICPTAYSFEREGQRASAFILDGWRGAKVYIGTD